MATQREIGPFQVQPVGLGCMNVSFGYGSVSESDAIRLLEHACDIGCNFFDTATMYGGGENEKLIAKALASRRQEIVLASKCGLDPNGIDGRPATLTEQCHASLKRLQTDVIDLYYLHRVDPQVPISESVGALQRLVDQGKIRAIGLSEVCSENLLSALSEAPVAALQSEYSLWSRTPESGILDVCEKHNVAFVPFSPLGRGFLAGSASELASLGEKDLRRTIAHPRFEGKNYEANCKLLEEFTDVARRLNCTPAQLALAWLLHRQNKTMVPIPGTTSTTHMSENFDAANIELDAAMVASLDQLINEDTVAGNRYNDARMADSDAERDRKSA